MAYQDGTCYGELAGSSVPDSVPAHSGSLDDITVSIKDGTKSATEAPGAARVESSDSVPSQSVSQITEATDEEKRGDMSLQLTDQTNLLPLHKILPVFAGLAICASVSAFGSVVVATALPTISTSFRAGSISSWVPSSYMLTSTSFQPLYGRFSDIFGRKWTLYFVMTMYILGSLASGFSKSIVQLIVFRGFAGVGGGGILSMVQIIVSDIVSLRDRGKYQGIITGAVAVGFAVGPPVGGVLAQKVSWRWCFWITIPISLFAICIVAIVLPFKPVEGNLKKKLLAIDYLGTILTLVGSMLIILPLIFGGITFPWSSPIIIGSLFSGIIVVAMFCIWEWKCSRLPSVPMYIFKYKTVTGVFITTFISGFVFFSSLYHLPQFFQVVLGYSPVRSGVLLLPFLVSQSFASWTGGLLVSKTGRYRLSIYLGFSAWAAGCGLLSTITVSTNKMLLVVFMLFSGIGAGNTLQTTIVAAQASVPRRDVSVVTVVRNFVRQLGGALSLAIGSTLINNAFRRSLVLLSLPTSVIDAIINDPTILGPNTGMSKLDGLGLTRAMANDALDGYTRGFRWMFILNACLVSTAAIVGYFMIQHEELRRGDEEKLRREALSRSGGKAK